MSKILQMFTKYVVVFILVSCVCGLVFVVTQQNYRQNANDPQIQIVEDGIVALKDNTQRPLFGPDKFDITNSLSTFIGLYDKDGKALESNAALDGAVPQPPAGVFESARQSGQNRVTWQAKDNLRMAVVIMPIGNEAGEFLAAGRSLREVDKRINSLVQAVLAAWVIMMIVSLAAIFVSGRRAHDHHKETHTI